MILPPLLILRHGQTEWNVAGRLQGYHDSPLTERGRAQASAQRSVLARVWPQWKGADFVASPQGRVRETAQIVLDGFGAVPREDRRLMEAGAGEFQGLSESQIEARFPTLFAEHQTRLSLSFAAPEGESFEEVEARCRAFLSELTGPAVLFTHGATMAVLRGIVLGLAQEDVLTLDHRQGVIYAISNGKEQVLEEQSDFLQIL